MSEEEKIEAESKTQTSAETIEVDIVPEDVTAFKQSHWAWLMPSVIWIGLLLIVVFFDFLTMGAIPLLLAIGIAGPRYLRWRQTTYYLSNEALYLTMVGLPIIQKQRIFKLGFETMSEMNTKFGYFGRTLGYAEVGITFNDNRMARLAYMSDYSEFMSHISESPNFHTIEDDSIEVDEETPVRTVESTTTTETTRTIEQKSPTAPSESQTDTEDSPTNSKDSET